VEPFLVGMIAGAAVTVVLYAAILHRSHDYAHDERKELQLRLENAMREVARLRAKVREKEGAD
jgi:hypothetical protein